ncbi:hypothetical protein B5F10_12985 [Anaerotruncus colihominis]|uniref:D-alanyl-lipoteichoic acid biosynthesis protein DltD n=1 Tax=Anaerotruncus colihominis TaxID=169435 RepID=A0A1Y4MIH6_9FIRM|nr:hypothetical protein B5F11_13130 [Anaerotruncus colihominis]OUP72987.1 hypothetical protein B5F10_12985 [Anaerotruncus colihominis]
MERLHRLYSGPAGGILHYEHVRSIVGEYGVKLLDLTGFEYEPYFMCDTMHIGWKGWLAVDQALISYYYEQ